MPVKLTGITIMRIFPNRKGILHKRTYLFYQGEDMKNKSYSVFALIILLLVATNLIAIAEARLLRQPDVHADKIVFRYSDDLWTVSADGGNAVRLTSHSGTESLPYFSPDGKWIAFSAQYDGNMDVYIIPSGGGEPVRLTYHPGADIATGWTDNGKAVAFTSRRNSQSRKLFRLYTISIDGGFPSEMPIYKVYQADFSSDGEYLAFNPTGVAFNAWRRYRGGRSQFIWILKLSDYSVKKIEQPICNDTAPQWMGEELYFLSDRDKVMNLYKYSSRKDKLEKITNYQGSDIKSYGVCEKKIVFERDGFLHLLNSSDGVVKKLKINIPAEQLYTRERFVKAGKLIFDADISPSGKRAVFEARGEIVTVPAEKGDIRNLTRTPCKTERSPEWSPDGKSIAYFAEHNGEYVIKIADQKGLKKPKIIEIEEPTFFYDIVWSPDSKKLAFNDVRQNLYYLEVDKGKQVLIDTEPEFLSYPLPAWSPDSKWITYSKTGDNNLKSIYLYSLEKKKVFRVTDSMSMAGNPVFDRNGKYLYFSASTDTALAKGWLDMTSVLNQPTNNLYLVVLDKKEASPFKPESDEEKPADKDKKEDKKKKKDKKKEDKGTKINIDGIGDRIVSINVPKGRYSRLQAGTDGVLYYLTFNAEARKLDLSMYTLKKKKSEKILNDINGYIISNDGKKLLYVKQRFTWAIADAGKKITPGKGTLKTSDIETWSVPKLEWKQMLHEAWRINRDYFYDPGMHGQDWPAVWKKYEAYLPFVTHRSDLNYLIAQLIGELTVGHAYVGGGMYPDVENIPGGLLGADYEIVDGYYRIKKIYKGENWNPDLRSPLTEPAINVNEGDFILAVNGRPVKAPANIYAFFCKTAGKQVVLLVNDEPDLKNAQSVNVVPIKSESMLRHRDWIESNRLKVAKLSSGKVGYVYMPDTATGGFTYFNRYYFSQLNRHGMIIDERYNSGGMAADYVVNLLDRKILNWWLPRYGKPFASPNAANFGSKVMIIDEMAGSGGDYLPYAFRERGIGKLVGKRTWGGLVGISGYPRLMDGGYVTAPSFAYVDLNGEFTIENEGVTPDIEVDITPADYKAGKDSQLLKALEVVMKEIDEKKLPRFKPKRFPRGR